MFVLSNAFTFMSFSAKGVGQEMTFLQCITTLVDQGYLFLGVVLSLTLIGLPLVYIGSIMLVLWRLDNDLHSHALRSLGRLLCRIKPWLMVDVFLIGVLISLVKLMGMADIKMGLSFWAFVGYTLLLIKMISSPTGCGCGSDCSGRPPPERWIPRPAPWRPGWWGATFAAP